MSTTATAGLPATIVVQFTDPGTGQLADLDADPTLSVVHAVTAEVVHGPTGDEVNHPALGTYSAVWQVPAALPPGQYLATFDGQLSGQPATQVVQVSVAPGGQPGVLGTVPCPGSWQPEWCKPLPNPGDHPGVDVDHVVEVSTQAAAEMLYNRTVQRFGLCTLTLRPCRSDCTDQWWPWRDGWWQWTSASVWPAPALIDGAWFNLVCGGSSCSGRGCSCRELSEALLPGPVHSITQVKVDGQVLTAGVDYRLDDHRRLVRRGGQHWPRCQRMDLDDDAEGTWSVTAVFGEPVPAHGRLALGQLAREMIAACLGEECQLSPNVQTLVRQGVTMSLVDPETVFGHGRTGLTHVDSFISWANPGGLTSPPQVYDVDGPGWRRTDTGAV